MYNYIAQKDSGRVLQWLYKGFGVEMPEPGAPLERKVFRILQSMVPRRHLLDFWGVVVEP